MACAAMKNERNEKRRNNHHQWRSVISGE